jgi:hypothetical protein
LLYNIGRQLEFAFFSALTSVGALFCFYTERVMPENKVTALVIDKQYIGG